MPTKLRFRPLQQQWRKMGQLARLYLHGFWRGYEPDLAHQVTEANACDEMSGGLVVRGEYIVIDDGFKYLEPAHLPLGYDSNNPLYTDGVNIYGPPITPATGAGLVPQPIVGVWRFPRLDSSTQSIDTIVMTAVSGTVVSGMPNPPFDEMCFLFRIGNTVATWTGVRFKAFDSVDAALPATLPPIATRERFPDAAVCSFGTPQIQYTTAAAVVHTIFGVVESMLVIVNGVDQVIYFPNRTGQNSHFTNFQSYYAQVSGMGTAVATDVPPGTYLPPSFSSFTARSVASAFGRAAYLNTIEGSSRCYQRFRWSAVGMPFCVWENVLIDASAAGGTPAAVLLSGVGAGYTDFDEFGGVGLRVEPLGDMGFACYFEDGVGFAVRGTTLTGAFRRKYITHDRGILSTHSVVNLGGGVHFGVFTDGWYLLDEFGGWKEVGRIGNVGELEDLLRKGTRTEVSYKWKHTFYNQLDSLLKHRTQCYYNPVSKFIYIQWWGTGGRQLWIYDVQNDRVSTDDYGNDSAWVFGTSDSAVGTLVTWAASAGVTWEGEAGQGSWLDLATFYNQEGMAHGTDGGYVFIHMPDLTTRNGTPANWKMRIKVNTLGAPGRHVLWHRMWLQFVNQESQCWSANVRVDGTGGDGSVVSETGSIDLAKGSESTTQSGDLGLRVPGDHHTVEVSGVGAPKIQALLVEFTVDDPDGIVAVPGEP